MGLNIGRFQSTHPCGVRIKFLPRPKPYQLFQSTHPCGVRIIIALQSQVEQVKANQKSTIVITDRDNKKTKPQTLTWLWYDDSSMTHFTYSQLSRRWTAHLAACGVRYRPLNNGRHTFASQVLSSGAVTAEWLANQLGHSNTDMIHKHYGKFIPKDASHIIKNLAEALK